ncbi:MAG TPA: hypothetical protein VNO32_13070 [Candidatus Acidoferrum sp.]|jgi:hypothetical protein|nr:hypothetical protein [Candidatus Acidoferrum sp.]
MLVMTDKLWAQLIVPPVITLVWILISSQILKLARPGGELDKSRSKLKWYGAAVLLAVMYIVWFHAELDSHWRAWVISFFLVAILIALIGVIRREEGRLVNVGWKHVLMVWIGTNLAGLVVVSIFRYFGN